MRPRLHRYCARMTGSVIDGEDVLQDALIKAVEAQAAAGDIGNPEGWLFRIAHNTALDFPAPAQPPGGAAIGSGGGHDR
jgi:RNA polymerase sigma-70 factor (ECF subfamily)